MPEFKEFEIHLTVPAPTEAKALLARAAMYVINTNTQLTPGTYNDLVAKDSTVRVCLIDSNTLLIQPQ